MPNIAKGPRLVGWLAGALPPLRQVIRLQLLELQALLGDRGLELGESLSEPLARHAERVFGIDLELSRQRDQRKEQISHLVEDRVGIAGLGKLAGFLGDRFGGAE